MSLSIPIFPTLVPGQSFTQPSRPLRYPSWSIKKKATFSNEKQQTVSGRVLVVSYWTNPLWEWELTYEAIRDDPSLPNPFYTTPIPATDLELLESFYCAMKGQGNEFAFQPPDCVRGGSFTATSVVVNTANIAVISINPAVSVSRLRLGDGIHCSGFSTATYLNTQNGTVISRDVVNNKITLSIPTSGTHAQVSDTGTLVGGQPLLAVDANNNTEVVNTIGSYPTTISAAPTTVITTESVQLADFTGAVAYANGTGTGYTLNQPNTVSPYSGYVLNFSSPPATPITLSYQYYYLCRFSEDTQEYDNFMAMLWTCNSVKLSQVRV